MARSLWAGLQTFHRWRQYIILSPNLKLQEHFISRAHYVTIELRVHAAILHFLALFLCFPEKSFQEYSLRNTGNRNIEALHGTFRGGTCSLPITTPNLSFREFLDRMNQMQQINKAEHDLKNIPGNTIIASKKKRKTFAKDSNESIAAVMTANHGEAVEGDYHLTYSDFKKQLQQACSDGDKDSQQEKIEELAPEMAKFLKKKEKWLSNDIIQESAYEKVAVVTCESDLQAVPPINFQAIIEKELGPLENNESRSECCELEETSIMTNQALANVLIDASTNVPPKHMTSYLRGLQPQREKPSKDRSRRFAAGGLRGNEGLPIDDDHQLQEFQFWMLFPNSTSYRNAKIFLLGQIVVLLRGGNAVRCAAHNGDTDVVMKMYSFNAELQVYSPEGYSSLLKATSLHRKVEIELIDEGDAGNSKVRILSDLQEFRPFHDNIEVDTAGSEHIEVDHENETEEYIVEKL